MDQLSSFIVERGHIAVSIAALLCGVFLFSTFSLLTDNAAEKIPIVGKEMGNAQKRRQEFLSNARQLYSNGHQRFKNKVFRLTSNDGMLPDTVTCHGSWDPYELVTELG